PAIVLIPAIMFVLLWVGDRFSIKKKKSDSDNLAAVTPAVLFYLVGLLAIFYWFSFVMSWRALVNNLVDVHEGRVDPLAALDKIPVAKKLMKWYHANLAIHTAGRYSILTVIAAEVFEFMVQTNNANNLAKYLDWRYMQMYASLIFANFVLFGLCILTPDRYIPSSALITIDVLIDATYIMFNIFFVSQPVSYWAIIIPLWFQVDMVNDSFTRQAQEQVNQIMIKEAEKRDFDEAKANGTLPEKLCAHLMAQLKSGEERGRLEASPPSGYSELKPRMWYFKNGLHSGATCGFGVDENPNEDTWELDVSGCGVEEFVGWKEPFADLQTLELGNNSLVELPTWLGDGKMKKLKEVRARGNVIEKECLSLGTDLPIVRSAEANEELATRAAKLGASGIWLGASDEEKEGEWVWVDGTPVDFEGWASKQPDDGGKAGEDFAALHIAGRDWYDLSNYEVEFLCEGDGEISCPPSEQPDLVNGGCESCPAGTESPSTDSDPCKLTSCAAGTYLDAAVGEGA
ncbi:hypothetical protein TeGR_g12895, partial [Tetraparma gracilis]